MSWDHNSKRLLLQSLVEASHVQRWHTMPHLTDASLGKHMWGVATIVLVLCPNPSVALLAACLTHDLHERWSGDTPYPARAENALLAQGEKEVQEQVWAALDHGNWENLLSDEERFWKQFADMAECALWARHETMMGNAYLDQARLGALKSCIDYAERKMRECAYVGIVDAISVIKKLAMTNRLSDLVSEIE